MLSKRQRPVAAVLACALCGAVLFAAARAPAADFKEMTPQARRAIKRGVAWLVKNQKTNGSWITSTGRHDDMGVMALGCLGLMAAGNTPGKGEHGRAVARGIDYIIKNAKKSSGLLHIGPAGRSTYNHGLATLALAEAYGMSHNRRTRKALTRAVDLIVDSQGDPGGWDYVMKKSNRSDTSLCVMQMMALRGAINSGIYVPQKTVDKGVKWLLGRHNPKGGFGYSSPGGINVAMSSAWSETAPGKLTWDSKEGKPVRTTLDWLLANGQARRLPQGGWGYYATYYYAQAMYQAGGKYWSKAFPTLRDNLVRAQQQDGSWSGSGSGKVMATGISVMVLCIPNRYLPIFQEERE